MRNIIVSGRVVSDAKIKNSASGSNYAEFRIANNEISNQNKNTYWFRVISFDERVLNIAKYITKGKPLNITGRYYDHINISKNGEPTINREIIAAIVDFEINKNINADKVDDDALPF